MSRYYKVKKIGEMMQKPQVESLMDIITRRKITEDEILRADRDELERVIRSDDERVKVFMYRNHDLVKLMQFRIVRVEDHPKRELLWSKAYALGHSSGYNEVLSYMKDLVDLIK